MADEGSNPLDSETTEYLPVAQLDSASDSDSEGRRFESFRAGQKILVLRNEDFLSKPQAWYIITRSVYIIAEGVYHHAERVFLRLDDIQHFVLMIYDALHR